MKKSKEQIISDYDTRNLVGFVGGFGWIITLGIIAYLELTGIKGFSIYIALSAFIVYFFISFSSSKCPICDTVKSRDYWEFFIFKQYKWSYSCNHCQLSDDQITNYFDLLIEGKDIDLEEFRNQIRKL